LAFGHVVPGPTTSSLSGRWQSKSPLPSVGPPRPGKTSKRTFAEARVIARSLIIHKRGPGFIDVGSFTRNIPCFLVTRLLEGGRPGHRDRPFTAQITSQTAELVAGGRRRAPISRTTRGHRPIRDVKPSQHSARTGQGEGPNPGPTSGWLLKDVDLGKGPTQARHPAYMSPEQAPAAEGHRVDGSQRRPFSLGVVFL